MLHEYMNLVFKALANANRRKMLDRLFTEPGLTLSELIEGLEMTRQSASRHVSILETSGLIVTNWSGREKLHYLNPIPIAEMADRWLDKFSKDKGKAMLALKSALEEKENK